jgi:hypothetical protein
VAPQRHGLRPPSEKLTLPVAYHDCQDVMVNLKTHSNKKTA